MRKWNSRRNILLAMSALCLLLVLAIGAFAGAAVYFRMEREGRAHYVSWQETQAIAFAEQGRPFEALVTVHRVSNWNRARSRSVRRVLPILVRGGHDEAVLRYQETHRYIRNPPPGLNMTSGLDVKLAIVQAELGRMDAAAETVRRLTRQRDRAAAMKAVALIQLARGERLEALAMARQIPSRRARAETLGSLALLLAEDADPATIRLIAEEALALARSVEERDEAVLRMARLYVELGYHREALALAAATAPSRGRGYALGDLAAILAEAGEIALARQTASLETGPEGVKQVLVAIMSVQIGRGDAAGAMVTFALLPAGVDPETAFRHATFEHRFNFQFRQWEPHIAATLLDFADMAAEAGVDPVELRHCLLGDALAAGDVATAARAWVATGGDRHRPSIWEAAGLLLHGRRLCRSIS